MKKWLLKSGMILFLAAGGVFTAYAGENPDTDHAEEVCVVSEMKGNNLVEIKADARGTYLSSVNGRLTRESSTVAGIFVDVVCHENVEKIKLAVTLQKNDGSDTWENVDRQDFTWLAEDNDNNLSYAYVSYKVRGLKSGASYRIKATGSCTSTSGKTETRTMTGSSLTF